MGLILLSSPVHRAERAATTPYLLTDRRAIVCTVGLRPSIREYGPASLAARAARERDGGVGNLFFEER